MYVPRHVGPRRTQRGTNLLAYGAPLGAGARRLRLPGKTTPEHGTAMNPGWGLRLPSSSRDWITRRYAREAEPPIGVSLDMPPYISTSFPVNRADAITQAGTAKTGRSKAKV